MSKEYSEKCSTYVNIYISRVSMIYNPRMGMGFSELFGWFFFFIHL